MRTEATVARLLFLGGVISVVLMLTGLVDFEAHAAAGAVDVVVSVPQLVRSLRRWPPDPIAITTSGVIVLLLTPALGLAAALVGFVQDRDRAYAIIASLLILALLVGFAWRVGG